MKYVQINSFYNGSTGNIMRGLHEKLREEGHESYIFWGRSHDTVSLNEQCFASRAGVYSHAMMARLTDRVGFYSSGDTRRLIQALDDINPDIVHLHNLHGYYLNIELLFEWLNARSQQTIWTLHDCWSFTGHCPHFVHVGCEQWKSECERDYRCPMLHEYPKTLIVDRCKANFRDKRRLFTALPEDKMTIRVPSNWLAARVRQSYLSKYRIEVQYNSIDELAFKPTASDFRKRYSIGERFLVLGVASPWTERKGLSSFIRLADELDDSFSIALIGLSNRQIKKYGSKVIALPRTESKLELAKAYTAADVFVNPSIEETFGLTVAEAQACGTTAIAIIGTACAEIANPDNSILIEADYEQLKSTIISLKEQKGL